MLFNSIDFLIFLPLVFLVYWLIPAKKVWLQNILILVASYVFYGWWDWRFLFLILFSTLVDFFVGRGLSKELRVGRRKLLLWISLSVNLGFLGFFKYYNFFVDSFADAFTLMGMAFQGTSLQVILPVGISFYTFQTLSYSIDVYKRKLQPTSDFIAFSSFVSFFPQLVAGPIERASHLLPQFYTPRKLTYQLMASGLKLIIMGFFMKLVVADRAAIYVNAVYNHVPNHQGITFVAATLMFAFQIYGDFAGYSLIAIGTARWFGFDLMQNFNRPYFARSVGEFWKRWHISLSSWFRDYVYIPLGGNRISKIKWLTNLFFTFLLSGLWHGANWTFVVWGALNGFYLIFEAAVVKPSKNRFLGILSTFILINFSWIFFRANNLSDAFLIVHTIFTNPGKLFLPTDADFVAPIYAGMAIFILLLIEGNKEIFKSKILLWPMNQKWQSMLYYGLIVIAILSLGIFNSGQFIYFQF
ncbi:D-alanyl-lipoteichoic acid acyltransferase DltB, MBOAT superfamily [Algoriphagus locisalis]|uniref:D-alanyl-lipoteichoic acid acyltransferase DltB, MBOAT superfamily n=1 Tax=Algoriphagus locisalis TaxID=305507 RepID=A0A1I7BQX9_9BACT|nr:MBOAT family O-acyltransferase [Algoriphagus locisalis]SFT89592.1 D-alanyl-lipoteichoic acid acyltransferase DltB, MBOAT superfamily [Algoriphagus locisalis]